jgi:dolichol-phosphate mannosyltransferase
MSFKRSLLSTGANFIARHGLCLKNVYDPMSGFFAFPKHTLHGLEFNTDGFKILLEILIKKKILSR